MATRMRRSCTDYFCDSLSNLDVPALFFAACACCRQSKLCYIGFSQGTAQAFAAFSSNPDLLEKVQLFVALSPAVRANHLSKSLLLSLVQANLRCRENGGFCSDASLVVRACGIGSAFDATLLFFFWAW